MRNYTYLHNLEGELPSLDLSARTFKILLALLLLMSLSVITAIFVGAAETTEFEWHNTTWRHRVGFEITADTDTENWPIERQMNFTALLEGENNTGDFDRSSVRVFEYGPQGDKMHEVPYQFDEGSGYNVSTNAHGTLTFMLNGTTTGGTTRYFFVYFDSKDHGEKPGVSFPTSIEYSEGGEQFTVNTSKFNYTVDTERGDNTSGLVRAQSYSGLYGDPIMSVDKGARTAEYIEYTNGTHDFTFNLSHNVSFTTGPLRLTVTQRGFQDFYGIPDQSQRLKVTKKYRFYNLSGTTGSDEVGYAKIEQTVENVDDSDLTIESTPGGGLAVDVNRTLSGNRPISDVTNSTDPFSWVHPRDDGPNIFVGLMNLNEQGGDFLATTHDLPDNRFRAGMNMSPVTLQPGDSFSQTTFFSPGGTVLGDGINQFAVELTRMFQNQPSVVQKDTDTYSATVEASTNETVYNRGENVRLLGNITSDPFNVTSNVSAVLDMNTSTDTDDVTRILSNDGTGSWALWDGQYQLGTDSNVGEWTLNVSAETNESIDLDHHTSRFTVTDEYFANLTVADPVEVIGKVVKANLTLETFRQDKRIEGAEARCSIDGSEIENVSEFGNGIYSINFTAPSPSGDHTLACNGTRSGNLGNDTSVITSEVAKVVLDTSFFPSSFEAGNISLRDSQNFTFLANFSNPENGTAYSTNASFTHPENWTLNTSTIQCGDLRPGEFCSRNLSAKIPESTSPGNFKVNTSAEWVNPDDSSNETNDSFPVEVLENPVINVSKDSISADFGGGRSETVGEFTVRSLGNTNLSNVNFTCSPESGQVCENFSTRFSPENISTIRPGENRSVSVSVHVPKRYDPGLYNGTLNVSSDRRFDNLNVSVDVIGETDVSTSTIPPGNITAENVTLAHGETLDFKSNSTNIDPSYPDQAFAFSTNASVSLPPGWGANVSARQCGDLNISESCTRTFFPEVPNATEPGNYSLTASSEWINPDGGLENSSDTLTAVVEENPVLKVIEDVVNGSVPVNSEDNLGNFTLESLGNVNVSNTDFSCIEGSGAVCDNFTTEFSPSNISAIEPGENRSVTVNVSVPSRFPAGEYTGTLNASSSGSHDLLTLDVTVPETRSWSLDPLSCETSSDPAVGVACRPTVNNTGNTGLNITISPEEANNTAPEPRNFSVPFGSSERFNMTYNVTGVEEEVHNANYNISTLKESAVRWRELDVTVLPAVAPKINITMDPYLARQNDTLEILANVTATSGFPLDQVRANVTQPGNVSVMSNMRRVENLTNVSSESSKWRLYYPNGTSDPLANTTFRGNYTVNVTANDTLGNDGFSTDSFKIAAKLSTELETLFENYDRGDEGSISYRLEDFFGDGIGGASVNLTIWKSDNFQLPLEQSNPFTTSPEVNEGYIDPRPTFDLADDAPLGIYDLEAEAEWYDPVTNRTEEENASSTFAVGEAGDFKVRWDAGSVWYGGANFTTYVSLYKGENRVNADMMNITVYESSGEVFKNFNQTDVQKRGKGLYSTFWELPEDPEKGIYWTKLVVENDGDKAVRFQSFRMATDEVATGPFDIRLSPLEFTEKQGEFLDFNVTIINMGTESGDSKLTYWVTKNGTEYSYVSETVYTEAGKNLTIPRNVFIFGDQPPGTYKLNAKVEPLDSSIEPATASSTFKVEEAVEEEDEVTVEEETETVEKEVPPEEPEPEPLQTNLSIIDAPEELNLARGVSTYNSITIANTGETELENLTTNVVGVPSGWVSVDPADPVSLPVQETTTFTVSFEPSKDAERRDYNGTILATSNLASGQQPVDISVFRSMEAKIREDIQRLGERLEEVKVRMEALQEEGADVSGVETMVQEIEVTIQNANESLQDEEFEKAMQSISEAEGLIGEAETAIERIEVPETRKPFDILPLAVGAIVFAVIILLLVYAFRFRGVSPLEGAQHRFRDVFREMHKRRIKEQEELKEEKRKTKRLIELLDAQHEEEIMEDATYEELKSSAEDKLRRINSQLEES